MLALDVASLPRVASLPVSVDLPPVPLSSLFGETQVFWADGVAPEAELALEAEVPMLGARIPPVEDALAFAVERWPELEWLSPVVAAALDADEPEPSPAVGSTTEKFALLASSVGLPHATMTGDTH